jgi:phosphate starvation-inducible PhoH-like protein
LKVRTSKAYFTVEDNDTALALCGNREEHIRLLENTFSIKIFTRGTDWVLEGGKEDIDKAVAVLNDLKNLYTDQDSISLPEVKRVINLICNGSNHKLTDLNQDVIGVTARGTSITPKTFGQKLYVEAIRKNDIVFGIGPAGTGKTYLAMAMAVSALKAKKVSRLILTRPAVEAGESLGFLPGDLQDKVDPYLRPLYDALYDILGVESFQRYMERGVIEVAPLAYMRGRTLHDAFIILDEAQNTKPEQMKMFLTRLGFNSKMVVTGDVTQVDLPQGKRSGLIEVKDILADVEGIEIVFLGYQDVIRHELVQKIIQAYERKENAFKQNGTEEGTFPFSVQSSSSIANG